MARTATQLILLSNLLIIHGPNYCGASDHRLIETIDRNGTRQLYCGYLRESKNECPNKFSNGSAMFVCEEIQDPNDRRMRKCQHLKKTNQKWNRSIKCVLIILLVASLVLNASLVTYIIMRKRSRKSTSYGPDPKSSAIPPASRRESDNMYEEIVDLPFRRSPPTLPSPLRRGSLHDSENSVYQKYLSEKEEEMNRGSISNSTSDLEGGQYVEVRHAVPEEAHILGETAPVPVVGPVGDVVTGLSGLEEACKSSNRAEASSV